MIKIAFQSLFKIGSWLSVRCSMFTFQRQQFIYTNLHLCYDRHARFFAHACYGKQGEEVFLLFHIEELVEAIATTFKLIKQETKEIHT